MNRLAALFRSNFFPESTLGSIPYSCCPSDTTPVFDFDTIKDNFCAMLPVSKLKSVDALYFSPSGKLLLIEMKRFNRSGPHSLQNYILHHLGHSEIHQKIVDSLLLMLSISGYYYIDRSFYRVFLDNSPVKIGAVLLVNLSDREYISVAYLFAAQRQISFTKRIDNSIKIFNCKYFSHFLPTY